MESSAQYYAKIATFFNMIIMFVMVICMATLGESQIRVGLHVRSR